MKYKSWALALGLVMITVTLVTVWDGYRRLGERVLGEYSQQVPAASSEATLTSDMPVSVDDYHDYLSTLQALDAGVYQLHLTQMGESTIISDYQVIVTPEWTVITPQTMIVENNGVRDEISLSSPEEVSYTHYQLQANGDVWARIYTRHGDQWQESAQQTLTSAQKDLTYGHLWSVAYLPIADEPGRLTAAALDGGTYHFYFAAESFIKAEFVSDDGHTRLEYHHTSESPEINLPDELLAFVHAQE
ncbi:hypothetical protein IJJ08_02945 [bacterium]|nr:hypothetical protein [bacterium]